MFGWFRRKKVGRLSYQTLVSLSDNNHWREWVNGYPMICPFHAEKVVIHGRSQGGAPASYDLTIGEDITLGVNPAFIIADYIKKHSLIDMFLNLKWLKKDLMENPSWGRVTVAQEYFRLPDNVSGEVADKSTNARLLVTFFNTYFDPGFEGSAVLEVVNLGYSPIRLLKGTPVAQMVFDYLDEPTTRPYRGKYFKQQGAQGAIMEKAK